MHKNKIKIKYVDADIYWHEPYQKHYLAYDCNLCNGINTQPYIDGVMHRTRTCAKCGKKVFAIVRKSAASDHIIQCALRKRKIVKSIERLEKKKTKCS